MFVSSWTCLVAPLSVLDPTGIAPLGREKIGGICPVLKRVPCPFVSFQHYPYHAGGRSPFTGFLGCRTGEKSAGFVAFCRAFLAPLSVFSATSLPVSHRGRGGNRESEICWTGVGPRGRRGGGGSPGGFGKGKKIGGVCPVLDGLSGRFVGFGRYRYQGQGEGEAGKDFSGLRSRKLRFANRHALTATGRRG